MSEVSIGWLRGGARSPWQSRDLNVSQLQSWNSISIVLVCVFSMAVHITLLFQIALKSNCAALVRDELVLLGSDVHWGHAGALGASSEPCWIFFIVLVSVGDYEVSPTPPITVTHKPEEDTFGVSPVLSTTVLRVFLINGSVFTVQRCFEMLARKKSLPLWFKSANKIRRILWFVLGKQSTDVNCVSLLGLLYATRELFENKTSCEVVAGRSEILTLKK